MPPHRQRRQPTTLADAARPLAPHTAVRRSPACLPACLPAPAC